MHWLQIATLMVCVIISSAKEETFEKKCAPKGFELQPLDLDSIEDYEDLFATWEVRKCQHYLYCNALSCIEFTYGKSDKGVTFHASAFNLSSSKMWVPNGLFTVLESGGIQVSVTDKRALGQLHFLALNEKYFFVVECFDDKSLGAWICTKGGKKLNKRDLKQLKEIAKKNGFKWEDFKEPPNEDCEKIKAGY